jgi:hypothetical protein
MQIRIKLYREHWCMLHAIHLDDNDVSTLCTLVWLKERELIEDDVLVSPPLQDCLDLC